MALGINQSNIMSEILLESLHSVQLHNSLYAIILLNIGITCERIFLLNVVILIHHGFYNYEHDVSGNHSELNDS